MRKKLIQKWLMYHEIHRQHREGLKSAQIARELGLDRRTIRKYLAMSENEYLDFMDNQLHRQKVLVPYEDFVRARLELCADASAAQVHDWLKEVEKPGKLATDLNGYKKKNTLDLPGLSPETVGEWIKS